LLGGVNADKAFSFLTRGGARLHGSGEWTAAHLRSSFIDIIPGWSLKLHRIARPVK
jgi:hypothetical protein